MDSFISEFTQTITPATQQQQGWYGSQGQQTGNSNQFDNDDLFSMGNNNNNDVSNNQTQFYNQVDYLPGQMLIIGEKPNQPIWCFQPLYKVSQTGGVLMWQIGFDGNDRIVTIFGYAKTTKGHAGKIQRETAQIFVSNRNSNIHEQALQECNQRTIEKKREGYDLTEEEGCSELSIQKGHPFYFPGDQVLDPDTNELKDAPQRVKKNEFPVILDVKVDGVRGRIRKVGDQIVILSTNKKLFKYKNHIREMLRHMFQFLPPGVDIDGELYCPWMTFQDIVSVVKTENFCHDRDKELGFYIFDIIIPNMVLQQRINMLRYAYFECVKLGVFDVRIQLLKKYIAYNFDDIRRFHEWATKNGWEGAIIRKLAVQQRDGNYEKQSYNKSIYKGGKNNNILKVKKFIDEECLILDVTHGNGREEHAAVFICRDMRGNQFNLRPNGSIPDRERMLMNKHSIIGRVYTFKYFDLTNDGLPKFPTGKGFRDYE